MPHIDLSISNSCFLVQRKIIISIVFNFNIKIFSETIQEIFKQFILQLQQQELPLTRRNNTSQLLFSMKYERLIEFGFRDFRGNRTTYFLIFFCIFKRQMIKQFFPEMLRTEWHLFHYKIISI